MYICPTCNKGFKLEKDAVKHLLACWKEKNPHNESKPAQYSMIIVDRKVSNDVSDFFSSFRKDK